MSPKPSICPGIEVDLVATATGDAPPAAAQRVQAHVARCAPCADELHRYRAIDGAVGSLRTSAGVPENVATVRQRLDTRLAELRERILRYGVFATPLGRILLAKSKAGVALVEYVPDDLDLGATRLRDADAMHDDTAVEQLYRELLEYLEGKRTTLSWPLDFDLARGDFDRAVLQATSRIPYGAVTSYTKVARELGSPSAVRAVAQALRWNPLPIVVPCHRVVGASGALTGYAGAKVDLKHRLLAVEGVRSRRAASDFQVCRDSMYVSVAGDSEYCVPTCGSLASETLARLTLFASRDRAEAVGLGPCTTCRPDLHPLTS